MATVQDGSTVKVHYTGTLTSGEVFDSSEGRDPLEVTIGQGQLIGGFESALIGMAVNETKTFTLEPDQAYGPRDEEAIRSFPRDQIPPGMDVQVGQMLALSTPEGQQIPAKVTDLDNNSIILDLNHPLAGESLTFAIEVVGISG